MHVTLSESSRASDLAEYLSLHGAYISHTHAGVIEVGFVGSLSVECQWGETERRVQAWVEANPGIVAAISE